MTAHPRPSTRRVVVFGMPGHLGGANTECWHTVRLWRQHGLDISLIPTWHADEHWQSRLEAIGCRILLGRPDRLDRIDGLHGSVVVSFCNSHFLRCAERLRALGCRTIWLNCMTWLFAAERLHYRHCGPFDAYVFQSHYQQAQLQPQLERFGVRPQQCHRIRGAFCWDEFPFAPLGHAADNPLVLGRISRASPDKFHVDSWAIYGRLPLPIHVRILGCDRRIERRLGRPPVWAECLAAGSEPADRFYHTLHCLVPLNGGAAENWPRCGLEAMAAGVPVVAENRWGWPEMIRHGHTGFLWNTHDELAHIVERLGRDERLRLQVAHRARHALETDLADRQTLWAAWESLFRSLGIETNATHVASKGRPEHGERGSRCRAASQSI